MNIDSGSVLLILLERVENVRFFTFGLDYRARSAHVAGMEKEEVNERISAHATTLLSLASMFEAMDQGTAGTVNLQTYAMGEAARTIQRSTMAILELVDSLDKDPSA